MKNFDLKINIDIEEVFFLVFFRAGVRLFWLVWLCPSIFFQKEKFKNISGINCIIKAKRNKATADSNDSFILNQNATKKAGSRGWITIPEHVVVEISIIVQLPVPKC